MQRLTIRIMILFGVLAMAFFFWEITKPQYIGYPALYYPLLFSLLYMGLRLLYEWYHYWDISVPETPPLKQEFSVDIFTTYVPGEPYDMLINTLEAIQAIEYPHTCYLCDEGDDPYLKEQCERLGVIHVYRGSDKKNAKAGNINHAIYTHAQGDICLILDPDHVPAPDFLNWVLPHFQNPEVGFVQVVQAYENIYENLIAKASSQQTFQFYGPIMMSMNKYGTAQAIGANCTFRRAALDSIGGHAAGLAEDMHTSMQLHAKAWKSVYVPRVLSRGLVPNTVSAYYKQQLKWSRGVFELLLSTYPKLFPKLSWRQRLHYGLLPWHYFMGFLFLINFLVPIASLISGRIPMQVGLSYFLSYAAPLLTFIIIIRHYVQKWVMEEEERGFHIQGGLIAIGTWWIHCLGFIYTLLRRKVPYNPTPKDGQEENTIGLNIPNLAMAALSLGAIAYGLSVDLNPYSLIMAGFAGLNVLFLLFFFFASMQNQWRIYKSEVPWLDRLFIGIWRIKDWFWRLRHGSYQFLRIIALPIALLAGVFIYFQTSYRDITLVELQVQEEKKAQHFSASPGLNTPDEVWYQSMAFFSDSIAINQKLQRSKQAEKYPYIEWAFYTDSLKSERVIKELLAGLYDRQLDIWVRQFQQFSSAIYLAPFPDFQNGNLDLQPQLWDYLKAYFNGAGVNNLMTIYTAPSAEQLKESLPDYALLSFIEINADSLFKSKQPSQALQAYLIQEGFQVDLPWLLSFKQSLQPEQLSFIDSLASKEAHFAGLIFKEKGLSRRQLSFKSFAENTIPKPDNIRFYSRNSPSQLKALERPTLVCNYYKGLEWQNTRHPLFRRVIEADFQEMKNLGISHINRYGPSIYNNNILKEAQDQNMGITYCFYIGDLHDFSADNPALKEREERILSEVRKRRDESTIISWHIGGAAYNYLDQYYHPPSLFYQRQNLINWLASITKKIKAIDGDRKISTELIYNPNVTEQARSLFTALKEIDGVGISFDEKPQDLELLEQRMAACQSPLFIHSINPEAGARLAAKGYPISINSWQDDIFENYVSLNGLKNLDGYKKRGYTELEKLNKRHSQTSLMQIEDFKVIPMAKAAFRGQMQTYSCLVKTNNRWAVLNDDRLQVDWYLARLNDNGEPAIIKSLDEKGPVISINLPNKPENYWILAYIVDAPYTLSAKSNLNSPIYLGPKLHTPTEEEIQFFKQKTL